MNIPVVERITLDIVKALSGINTAAGYGVTISSVERRNFPENEPAHLKAIVCMDSDEQGERTTAYEPHTQTYQIAVYWIPPESNTMPEDEAMMLIWAGVHRALLEDKSRGNNANWTRYIAAEWYPNYIVMTYAVQYDCRTDDLTRSRTDA